MVDADGIVYAGPFPIPFSNLASREALTAHLTQAQRLAEYAARAAYSDLSGSTDESILAIRAAAAVTNDAILERVLGRYPATIAPGELGGVRVDVVEPADGVPDENRSRVLVNLHGGGMAIGRGSEGHVLSVPLAVLGGYRVISVDYRMAPEHTYPAAHEDVAAVYESLLGDYEPGAIGIYGHSSGGTLSSTAVSWFLHHGLPAPGAIGVLEAQPGLASLGGDSSVLGPIWHGVLPETLPGPWRERWTARYWSTVDLDDPIVSPTVDPELLARFPPTAFLSGTRDQTLSGTLHGHIRFVRAGVDAELYVWEGMGHDLFTLLDTPEYAEALDILVGFFRRTLA